MPKARQTAKADKPPKFGDKASYEIGDWVATRGRNGPAKIISTYDVAPGQTTYTLRRLDGEVVSGLLAADMRPYQRLDRTTLQPKPQAPDVKLHEPTSRPKRTRTRKDLE